MNDILDIEIILNKQKYPTIYNIGFLLTIILLVFLYISFTYQYKTYYIAKGTMVDGDIKLFIQIDDIKYFTNNDKLIIDNVSYDYIVDRISEEIYVDETFNNYKYVYLNVKSINNINNYVYEIKLVKENKTIIEYLKEYL